MSTRHADHRELWVLVGLSLLLVARSFDTATTIPVLLAQPAAEQNPLVHAIVGSVGIVGYTAVSLLAAPAVVLLVEGVIELDRRFLDSDYDLPSWVVRLVCYGLAVAIAFSPVPYNIIQLAAVIP